MYLILSDADDNATLSRASEVFHDGVDLTRLRAAREEKVHRRRYDGEGSKKKIRQKRFDVEDRQRRSNREDLTEKIR